MPTAGDISQFLLGQAFGNTAVPSVDLTGKTIIVTGANTGLGFECVKHLIQLHVSKVIIACRNIAKGEAAKAEILKDNSSAITSQIEVWEVDLSHYKSVLSFGERVRSSLDRLDGFIANAGVEMTEFELAEGLEMTLTVNVVSTYLTALEVLPKLEETAAKYNTQVNLSIVGSLIHNFGPDEQLDVPESMNTLEALSDPKTADMDTRYPLSKLIGHLIFRPFVEHVPSRTQGKHDQVVVNLVNPGWCGSELSRHKTMSWAQQLAFSVMGRTAEQGSRTLVHAVTAGKETHEKYLSECQIKSQSQFMQSGRGELVAKRLWRELMTRIEKVTAEKSVTPPKT